jgi:hypothetical protein
MQDNISTFSQTVTEYLTTLDRPLKWLLNEFVTPQGIKPEQLTDFYLDGAGLDKILTDSLIAAIEERCAYERNPDRPLIEKLKGNYANHGVGDIGLFNLMTFIEKNSGAVSDDAKDYLLTLDDPLDWLGFRFCEGDYALENGIDTANGINGDEAIALIETFTEGEEPDEDVEVTAYEDGKTGDFDQTHIIASAAFYGHEIKLGEDMGNEKPYYVETGDGFGMRTGSYMDALIAYAGQIKTWADEEQAAYEGRVAQGLEGSALTAEHCLPGGESADFTNRLIIVDAKYLTPEYRNPESQLVECTHGSGARPDAKGTSVFGKELHSGVSVVYGRHQILGVADESKLPEWAKMKIEMRQDPSVFEYGGHHFKPERQFRKGEVDRHIDGDSRPWKTDAQYAMRNMRYGNELGLREQNGNWSYEAFYDAAKGSEADIFRCVENGKLFVPCAGALCQYEEPPERGRGREQLPRQKEEERPDFLKKLGDNKLKSERDKAAGKDEPPKSHKRSDREVI